MTVLSVAMVLCDQRTVFRCPAGKNESSESLTHLSKAGGMAIKRKHAGMHKDEIPLADLAASFKLFNKTTGKSPRTVEWYELRLELYGALLVLTPGLRMSRLKTFDATSSICKSAPSSIKTTP
ncbi:hypothetical protein AYO38_04690 [bacterium SCGC AG-212-C10]|nr:hypothetical protein AYO38_04690 [bacterium SCGC AG-212-C10]